MFSSGDSPLPIDTGGVFGALPGSQGGGDTSGNTTANMPEPSPPVTSGNPVVIGVQAAGKLLTSTVSSSILSYIFTSRFVLFIIGIILIIAGLYMLKPGPVTNVITGPVRAGVGAIKAAGAEAVAA
jgi:hypothetical protein